MAHLFVYSPDASWEARLLSDACTWLSERGRVDSSALLAEPSAPQIHHAAGAGADRWFLLASCESRVRVNGTPLIAGIRALHDRDQITMGVATSFYFSTESLARVEPFVGGGAPTYCPRCKQTVVDGCASVRCPQCAVVHHESVDLGCWSYAGQCALCDQVTDLSSGFRWTPEAT